HEVPPGVVHQRLGTFEIHSRGKQRSPGAGAPFPLTCIIHSKSLRFKSDGVVVGGSSLNKRMGNDCCGCGPSHIDDGMCEPTLPFPMFVKADERLANFVRELILGKSAFL